MIMSFVTDTKYDFCPCDAFRLEAKCKGLNDKPVYRCANEHICTAAFLAASQASSVIVKQMSEK